MSDDIREYWKKRVGTERRDTHIAWRISKREKEQLDREAADFNTSVSELIREKVFGSELPPGLRDALSATADAMHLPVNTVKNHMLIRRAAFDAAYRETFGRSKQVLKEFFFKDRNDGGKYLVTGDELFDILKEDYLRLFAEFKRMVKELIEMAEKYDADTNRLVEKFHEFVEAH